MNTLTSNKGVLLLIETMFGRRAHMLTAQSRYIFTLEGKEMKISASDPQPVRIPATARHTFKADDTHEGPCTVEISTQVSPNAGPESIESTGASAQLYVLDPPPNTVATDIDVQASEISTHILTTAIRKK